MRTFCTFPVGRACLNVDPLTWLNVSGAVGLHISAVLPAAWGLPVGVVSWQLLDLISDLCFVPSFFKRHEHKINCYTLWLYNLTQFDRPGPFDIKRNSGWVFDHLLAISVCWLVLVCVMILWSRLAKSAAGRETDMWGFLSTDKTAKKMIAICAFVAFFIINYRLVTWQCCAFMTSSRVLDLKIVSVWHSFNCITWKTGLCNIPNDFAMNCPFFSSLWSTKEEGLQRWLSINYKKSLEKTFKQQHSGF